MSGRTTADLLDRALRERKSIETQNTDRGQVTVDTNKKLRGDREESSQPKSHMNAWGVEQSSASWEVPSSTGRGSKNRW